MVIAKGSSRNMHISILLFDEEQFEKIIRFLATFWKKVFYNKSNKYDEPGLGENFEILNLYFIFHNQYFNGENFTK